MFVLDMCSTPFLPKTLHDTFWEELLKGSHTSDLEFWVTWFGSHFLEQPHVFLNWSFNRLVPRRWLLLYGRIDHECDVWGLVSSSFGVISCCQCHQICKFPIFFNFDSRLHSDFMFSAMVMSFDSHLAPSHAVSCGATPTWSYTTIGVHLLSQRCGGVSQLKALLVSFIFYSNYYIPVFFGGGMG